MLPFGKDFTVDPFLYRLISDQSKLSSTDTCWTTHKQKPGLLNSLPVDRIKTHLDRFADGTL